MKKENLPKQMPTVEKSDAWCLVILVSWGSLPFPIVWVCFVSFRFAFFCVVCVFLCCASFDTLLLYTTYFFFALSTRRDLTEIFHLSPDSFGVFSILCASCVLVSVSVVCVVLI